MRKTLILATALFLLAAIVRIINIDGPALWTDEGFVYYTFKIPLFDAILGDRHPPFYFYTLHTWESLTGDSILALRWWSMLPSMLSLAVVYQIGRELMRYRPGIQNLPLLAMLMLTLADAENYMAQELRMYTWHVLFAACSTWFYLRFLRNGKTRLWIIVNVLLMYTHYFGAFVLIVQGLHLLIFAREKRRGVFALVISGVLFAPWFLGVTLRQFADDAVCVNCATSQNWDILLDFREKWFGQVWALTLLLFFFGMIWLVRDRAKFRPFAPTVLLIGLILMPVAGTFALGHEEAVLLARRMVQITIPITLLIALGIANLRPRAQLVIAAALILYGTTTIDWYRIKVPWHTITDLIAEYAQPGELALMEVGFEESALLYYYDHQLPEGMQISSFPVWSDAERYDYYEIFLPELLNQQADLQNGVVTTWVTFFSPDEGILRKIEAAGFIRTMTRTYTHLESRIDVYRYDLLPDEAIGAFRNGMILRAFEITPDGRVDLWWSTEEILAGDYVVSVYLLNNDGVLVAQLDSIPPRSTLTWQPGEAIYDPRTPQGIDALPDGIYTIGVKVYHFTPEIADVLTEDGEPAFILGAWER